MRFFIWDWVEIGWC